MATVLRRMAALLILTAYVGAVMVQFLPLAHAMAGNMSSGIAHHQDAPHDKIPCKGTVSPCISDLGCVFLMGLATTPDPTLLTLTALSAVQYPGSPDALHGRSVQPAIGPPIPRA
jgi:hypothetical protein